LAYLIVLCKILQTPRYVREGERGFKCMKCGNYVELSEAKVITEGPDYKGRDIHGKGAQATRGVKGEDTT